MADINELRKEIDKHIQAKKEHYETIRYGNNHIKNKLHKITSPIEEDYLPKTVRLNITKEDIYSDLKDRYKSAWKSTLSLLTNPLTSYLGPGHISNEFSHVSVLKGKVLTVWEKEQLQLAERSYKAPKGMFLSLFNV